MTKPTARDRAAAAMLAVATALAGCQATLPSANTAERPSPTSSSAALDPRFWVRIQPDAIAQPPGFMEVHHDSKGQLQNMCAPCHPAVDTTMAGVTLGPAGFVAVGWIFQGFRGVAWHSADGTVWALDEPLPERTVLSAVAADGHRYVAVGLAGTGATVWTSADGVAWQQIPDTTAFAVSPLRLTSVVHWANGFEAAGYAGTEFATARAAFWWSPDGLTWQCVPDSADFANARVVAMTAFEGGLVAVGMAGPADAPGPAAVWTSRDGRSWRRVPDSPVFRDGRMRAVTWAPGIGVIAVGENMAGDTGAVWRSVDGVAWQRAPTSPGFGGPGIQVRLYAAGAGGPGVLAGGTANEGVQYGEAVIWSSSNGLSWERDEAGAEFADGELSDIWSDSTQLVAVGDRGAPDAYVATVWTNPPAWRR